MVLDPTDDEQRQGSARNQGTEPGVHTLAIQLSDLARAMHRKNDSEDILKSMVYAAIDLIPGVQEGSVSVVRGRKEAGSRAPSGELPAQIDALQTELGEGPCLDAAYEEKTVRVDDMSTEQRWPGFSKRASALGVASMLSFQLYVEGDNLGALNLYSRETHAFTDESVHVGLLVAAHAAVAFAEAQKTEQLTEALGTRDLIGQAKGVLMERYKVTAHDAFLLLTHASSVTNMKLREVAERLVNSGELPGRSSER